MAAFVAVLVFVLGAVAAAFAQLRCTDAAREAARLVARGDAERARAAAAKIAPDAEVAITVRGDTIQVDVRDGPIPGLPGLRLHADAYAISEPGATGSTS